MRGDGGWLCGKGVEKSRCSINSRVGKTSGGT